jgi:hypothetical protein
MKFNLYNHVLRNMVQGNIPSIGLEIGTYLIECLLNP